MAKIIHLIPRNDLSGPGIVANDVVSESMNSTLMSVRYSGSGTNRLERAQRFNIKLLMRAEIVHTHGFIPDFLGLCLRTFFKTKWVTTIHNHIYSDFALLFPRHIGLLLCKTWLWILSCSELGIVFTKSQLDYYVRYGLNNLAIIPNGRSTFYENDVSFRMNIEEVLPRIANKKILGFCGRLISRKNIPLVLDIIENRNDLALFIVGDGPEMSSLLISVKERNIDSRVIFFGHQASSRIIYEYVDCNILLSSSEGYPLNVIEASMAGVPTVCTNLDIYNELLPEEFRFLVDLEDINGTAEMIDHVLNGEVSKDQIREWARISMSSKKMARRYADIYGQ